jgi:hypothetical protein
MNKATDEEHIKNLEELVTARTNDLRGAVILIEELAAALSPHNPDVTQKARKIMAEGKLREYGR